MIPKLAMESLPPLSGIIRLTFPIVSESHYNLPIPTSNLDVTFKLLGYTLHFHNWSFTINTLHA
jgi:hypothetical protein